MLGFDALGRLALGQGAELAASNVVLITNAGSFLFGGKVAVFQFNQPVTPQSYVLGGQAIGLNLLLANPA